MCVEGTGERGKPDQEARRVKCRSKNKLVTTMSGFYRETQLKKRLPSLEVEAV